MLPGSLQLSSPSSPHLSYLIYHPQVLIVLQANSHRKLFTFFIPRNGPSLTESSWWSRRIWKSFIPFPSYQVFQRGAYFSVEVVPGALAVISLNTMYFYDSNKGERCPHCLAKSFSTMVASGERVRVQRPQWRRQFGVRLAGGSTRHFPISQYQGRSLLKYINHRHSVSIYTGLDIWYGLLHVKHGTYEYSML